MLYHIVAMANNRVIGKDNRLPWHFPEDLKHFKKVTTGNTVIMGRRTYESIGKPLPNRVNFVLSRNAEIAAPANELWRARNDVIARERSDRSNLRFFSSLEDALANVKTENALIIGGADLFNQTIHRIDGIYLTRIAADFRGDAFYPEIPDDFEEVEIEELREKDPHIEMVFYTRKPPADKVSDTLPNAL